jgi:stage II sporulation protein D
VPIAVKITVKTKAVVLWMSAAVLLCVLGGCEKRELIEPTPGMEIAERFWIKVLLFDNIKRCTLASEGGFRVIDGLTHTKAHFNSRGKGVEVKLAGGKIALGGTVLGGQVTVRPEKPFVFSVNGLRYRGNLELVVNSDGQSFDTINTVPLEAYLAGVVGVEMPSYWEPEVLEAQAVAARTYCLYIKNTLGRNRNWDVKKTQANQVYGGVSAESATVWEAVNETTGEVLVCKHEDGEERIFPAYYSSTCGGHTQNSKDVFGDSYGSLIGVRCPYCRKVAKMSFFFWPMAEFDAGQVSEQIIKRYPKLQGLGKIEAIEPTKVSVYDKFRRITSVKLIGENGKTGILRGEDLRLTLDPSGKRIRSAACEILKVGDKFRFYAGRGYGHGVGMCQCGAEGMARKGMRSEEILGYYYPSSKIVRIY